MHFDDNDDDIQLDVVHKLIFEPVFLSLYSSTKPDGVFLISA